MTVTIHNDCGRQVRGIYRPDPTEPGTVVEGMLTRDTEDPGMAWILSDATLWPVKLQSLRLL